MVPGLVGVGVGVGVGDAGEVFTYEMRYARALALWKIVTVWTSDTSWTRLALGVDEVLTVRSCDFRGRAECG